MAASAPRAHSADDLSLYSLFHPPVFQCRGHLIVTAVIVGSSVLRGAMAWDGIGRQGPETHSTSWQSRTGPGQVTKDVEVEDADPWPDAASRKLEAATATCARWSVQMHLSSGPWSATCPRSRGSIGTGTWISGIWIWISSEGKSRGPTESADDSSHVAAGLMHKLPK